MTKSDCGPGEPLGLAGEEGGVDGGGGCCGGFGVAEDFTHQAVALALVVEAGASGEDVGEFPAHQFGGAAMHQHLRYNAAVGDEIG